MAFSQKHRHYRAASKKNGCDCQDEVNICLEKRHLCCVAFGALALALLIFTKGILIGFMLKKD